MKYFVLLLCLILVSCGDRHDKPLIVKADGLIYEEGSDVPFTGVEKGSVNNKNIEYEVVNGEKHGYFKISDQQGNLETYGNISHNKYEGKWSYYYPGGKLESEGIFRNHMAEDEWKWYYPDGTLKEKGRFVEGEKEGEWRSFSPEGELKQVNYYVEGKIVGEIKDTL